MTATEAQSGSGNKGEGDKPYHPLSEVYVKPAPLWRSARLMLSVMGFFGCINLYALRVNLSVAIVCMVADANDTSNATTEMMLGGGGGGEDEVCLAMEADNQASNDMVGEFYWDKSAQGVILGAFFWGYIWMQVPGGWLAERYGGKRVLGYSMLVSAIATLLTPVAARLHWMLFVALRVIIGLGSAVVFPTFHSMFSHWAPPLERTKLIAFAYAGAQVGNVITMPISGLLCKYGFDNGWGSIFYVFGILGILWFIGWMLLVYDTPSVHPRISKEELDYIQGSLTGQIRKDIDKHEKIPWLKFLTSMPVWAIIVAHSCADWGTYTLLTQIPTFMKEVLKLDIAANGLFSAIPYVGYWLFTNVAGFSADFIRKKNWLSTVAVRKSYQLVAMALSSAFLIATGYMDCTKSIWAVVFLTLAVSGAAFQYGGEMVNQVDIAPRYAGVLFGIANTVSTLTGIAAPYMVSSLTKNKTQSQWQMVFYITGAICLFGAIFFAIFGSGVVQPWALAKEEEEEEDKEKVALEQEAAV